jgi:hypothetical protein
MPNPNLELLELATERLRPLLSEIVFVGGCATGLLIDDPGAAPVRGTYDVDVIAEIGTYAEYAIFSERLRALGLQEDASEGAPLCRWKHGELTLDVMPLDPAILGFSNRWYPEALEAAEEVQLPAGLTVRVITAPYFLGTKLEAFRGRDMATISPVMILRISWPWWTEGHHFSQNWKRLRRACALMWVKPCEYCSPNRDFSTRFPAICYPTRRVRVGSASL